MGTAAANSRSAHKHQCKRKIALHHITPLLCRQLTVN
jgi:hypothetical protein